MNVILKRNLQEVNWQALKDAYRRSNWDNGRSPQQLQLAFENSYTVCIAYFEDKLIGTARAISDGVRCAAIFDVWVSPEFRRQGIGYQIIQAILNDLEGQFVVLTTDIKEFYSKLGFRKAEAMVIDD